MRPSRSVVAAAVAAMLVGAAGCSQGPAQNLSSSGPSATTSPGEPVESGDGAPTSAKSPSASAVPGGFSLDDVTPPGRSVSGGSLGAVGIVRVGRHADFDRVVWQFAGRGRPSYAVHYVGEPLAEGSGDRVDVRGDAYLQVDVSTVGIPALGGTRPPDASQASVAGTVIVDARAIDGGFEGYGQAWIGVRGQRRPFRVIVLRNPTRLVVDIYSR